MFSASGFTRRHFISGVALAVVAAATLLTPRATAQTAVEAAKVAAEISRVASNLPPESRDVVTRLTMLRELPGGAWKMHGGDLAHGEDVSLDESSWQTFPVPGSAPNDAVWFRTTYIVPETLNGYDLTGSRIWFQFHADANGPMPEILYFNGRRVALGDDLEPVVLFDKAKPGEKVTVAIKLLHTVDTKSIRGATLRIEFPDDSAQSGRSSRRSFCRRHCLFPRWLRMTLRRWRRSTAPLRPSISRLSMQRIKKL